MDGQPNQTTKIMRLKALLVGFGFCWLALWAIAGSLMGYKLQEEIIAGQSDWLDSTKRELLRSTHAHMNSMALVIIATGLCLPLLARYLETKLLTRFAGALALSVVVFGLGMTLEVIQPPIQGAYSPASLVVALGGSVFIICCLIFGVAALRGATRP